MRLFLILLLSAIPARGEDWIGGSEKPRRPILQWTNKHSTILEDYYKSGQIIRDMMQNKMDSNGVPPGINITALKKK